MNEFEGIAAVGGGVGVGVGSRESGIKSRQLAVGIQVRP